MITLGSESAKRLHGIIIPNGYHIELYLLVHHLLQAIKRLRIGIGRPEDRTDVVDYVLRDFDPKELPLVEEVVERCTGLLLGQLQEVPSTEVVAIPGLSVSLTHQ